MPAADPHTPILKTPCFESSWEPDSLAPDQTTESAAVAAVADDYEYTSHTPL